MKKNFHNNHDSWINKIRDIILTPYFLIKGLDEYIIMLDQNLTSSMDFFLEEININRIFKNLFKGKQLQFIMLISLNLYLIYNNFSPEWPFMSLKLIYYTNLFMLICIIFMIYTSDTGYLTKNDEFENYIISEQPLIKQHICPDCKILRCLRSLHCPYCRKCVIKYELHSKWFNRCIGSKNSFIYMVFLLICSFHYSVIVIIFALQIFYFRVNRLFFYHFWFAFMAYLTFKLIKFSKSFINNARENITFCERVTWKRVPYLWVNMSKQFFNPFDKKSSFRNLRESFISFLDFPIDKIETNLNDITELIDTNQIKLNLSSENQNLKAENSPHDNENQITKSSSEYGFVSKNKECYYNYFYGDYDTLINWSKYRIYTLMDIHNSPMRRIVEESLKQSKI